MHGGGGGGRWNDPPFVHFEFSFETGEKENFNENAPLPSLNGRGMALYDFFQTKKQC